MATEERGSPQPPPSLCPQHPPASNN